MMLKKYFRICEILWYSEMALKIWKTGEQHETTDFASIQAYVQLYL